MFEKFSRFMYRLDKGNCVHRLYLRHSVDRYYNNLAEISEVLFNNKRPKFKSANLGTTEKESPMKKHYVCFSGVGSKVPHHSTKFDTLEEARTWAENFLSKVPDVVEVHISETVEVAKRTQAPIIFEPIVDRRSVPFGGEDLMSKGPHETETKVSVSELYKYPTIDRPRDELDKLLDEQVRN